MDVVFQCSPKYLNVASTALRALQLQQIVSPVLAERGFRARIATETTTHDALVILSKGYLVDAETDAVQALKDQRNILIADYVDRKPDGWIADIIDGFMASSHRQLHYLTSAFANRPCHLVTHHVDQRIGTVLPPSDHLRLGYFGELFNARHRDELSGLVAFIPTDTGQCSSEWFADIGSYNCHYGLRSAQHWDGFKPFLKGFTAAHCGAPIITEISEGDAVYYLPRDYPYFVPEGADVARTIRDMADAFGGPEWRYACDVMRDLRDRSSTAVVIREFEAMVSGYLS